MAEVCYVFGRLLGCLRSDVCHAGLRSGFSQLTLRVGIPGSSFWMKKLSIHAFDSSRYAACTWLQHSLWFVIFWPNLPFGSLGGRHFHQSAARKLLNVPCRRGNTRAGPKAMHNWAGDRGYSALRPLHWSTGWGFSAHWWKHLGSL